MIFYVQLLSYNLQLQNSIHISVEANLMVHSRFYRLLYIYLK